jgi:hypothetical protein
MKLFYKALAVLTALLIIVPISMVKVSAILYINDIEYTVGIQEDMERELHSKQLTTVTITGESDDEEYVQFDYFMGGGQTIVWTARTPNVSLYISSYDSNSFEMTAGELNSLLLTGFDNSSATISGSAKIEYLEIFNGETIDLTINGNAEIGTLNLTGEFNSVYLGPNVRVGTIENPNGLAITDERVEPPPEDTTGTPPADTTANLSSPAPSAPAKKPDEKLKAAVLDTSLTTQEGYTIPEVEITEDKPFEKGGTKYYGTVDIVNVDSDKPQEIPSEVFINGKRYLVGETVYIVGEEEKKIEATADTGFSYVFTAVENVDKPVKFTVEGLPDGLEMSEDGIITTTTLPAPVGTFEITVTADNGADTNVYTMTIEIKNEMTDEQLLKSLTENDIPELLTEPQKDVHRMWVNEELSIHYEPDIDDFYAVFLDGRLLTPEEDYRAEEGSTVIILTEQTIAPLPNGDHVVTTMFHQDSEVGLDTVINDVGSSSFVFRFGDEKSDKKRVNISGDGVLGSVTFDDKNTEETPITTISANTEAIEQRAKNLSNATGKEIIAAFETKQHGGFGGGAAPAGRIATFAVSVKSLDLSLKNGTAVYVAVYDSKTGKTYQNKGTVKDGMIVFKTKHSGVFMISLQKF